MAMNYFVAMDIYVAMDYFVAMDIYVVMDYFVGRSCLRPWVEYFAIHVLHSEMFPYLRQMSAALS